MSYRCGDWCRCQGKVCRKYKPGSEGSPNSFFASAGHGCDIIVPIAIVGVGGAAVSIGSDSGRNYRLKKQNKSRWQSLYITILTS